MLVQEQKLNNNQERKNVQEISVLDENEKKNL